MGDSISRKKLLDSLETQFEKVIYRVTEGSQYYVGFWNGLVEVKKTIDSAPVVDAEPKWIPVTERLPEETGNVIAYSASGWVGTILYAGAGRFEEGGVWAPITHWMPLPEPPKGE